MATSSPRWTPRWWHWLLLVVVFVLLLIFTVLLTLRTAGRADYQRVLTDLRAKGKVATLDEFIAQAPQVDVEIQEAWHRWSSPGIDYPESSRRNFNQELEAWNRYVMGEAPAPEAVLKEIEDTRALMEPARRLLQHDTLLVSALGWIAQDLPPGKRSLPHAASARIPSLLSTRALAYWLHHAACTESDPRPALDDLDRFHRALSRPGCLLDAMIWIAIANIRNETYVHLALLGRLPETNRQAWMNEPSKLIAGIADGFDGERTWFNDSWANMGEEMSFFSSFTTGRVMIDDISFGAGPTDPWMEWLSFRWLYSGPWMWATTHHDSAVTAELEAHISARLRGETTLPIPDWTVTQPRYWGYGAIGVPNLMESAITALEADAKHRICRLAVMLLIQAPTHGLPADLTALMQRVDKATWLEPPGDHLHLTYERLDEHRFRVVINPTSPVPNFDDPARMALRTKASGAPANKASLVIERHIEVQLPLRLRQSP
ncbi:MAG: hypothetical protein H0W78_07970 [Planctomycetes bacterium]|nr:hypothetical protein [Planctomycetota bacterium]